MLPSDIEGSLALTQLKNLNKNQDRRKKIWDFYQEEFKNINLIQPINCESNQTHSYFTYFIQFTNNKRNEIAKKLFDLGIYTTLRYHPLHLNDIFKSNFYLENTEKLNEVGLNIPLHQNLTDDDVNYVTNALKKIL